MVSGWDKHPPEYEPDIGWGGRLLLIALVILFGLAAFGWMLV